MSARYVLYAGGIGLADWVALVREKVALLSTSVRLTSNTQVGPSLKGNKVLAGSNIKRNEVVCLSALPFVAFLPVGFTDTFCQSGCGWLMEECVSRIRALGRPRKKGVSGMNPVPISRPRPSLPC
ncbi:hypothetical protein CGRA01v4_08044 [Colletotrichum graminicola]|nr:hypothetical protein CGRA01v4_08044 [Colletotrichum graminicola]